MCVWAFPLSPSSSGLLKRHAGTEVDAAEKGHCKIWHKVVGPLATGMGRNVSIIMERRLKITHCSHLLAHQWISTKAGRTGRIALAAS